MGVGMKRGEHTMTSITSNTSITRRARLALAARRARVLSVPLIAAGVLAAGCGTTHAGASGGASATASSAPRATVSAVPTVTGGAVAAGETACVGWPASATHGTVTALFDPVAVERCVSGFQTEGKTEWETATLEKSTKDLAPLVAALLQPSTERRPDVVCPELAVLPPQVLLISSTGKELIPRIPLGDCGLPATRVLSALATMSWQPVSVRLLTKVTGSQPGAVRPVSPKAIQTLPVSVPAKQS
jgi:hypothetical protein